MPARRIAVLAYIGVASAVLAVVAVDKLLEGDWLTALLMLMLLGMAGFVFVGEVRREE